MAERTPYQHLYDRYRRDADELEELATRIIDNDEDVPGLKEGVMQSVQDFWHLKADLLSVIDKEARRRMYIPATLIKEIDEENVVAAWDLLQGCSKEERPIDFPPEPRYCGSTFQKESEIDPTVRLLHA